MKVEHIRFGLRVYKLYTITVFKDTRFEREETVAAERFNDMIEKEIDSENYPEVRHIDEIYSYVVPRSEEDSESSIIESIEDAIISTEMSDEDYENLLKDRNGKGHN